MTPKQALYQETLNSNKRILKIALIVGVIGIIGVIMGLFMNEPGISMISGGLIFLCGLGFVLIGFNGMVYKSKAKYL